VVSIKQIGVTLSDISIQSESIPEPVIGAGLHHVWASLLSRVIMTAVSDMRTSLPLIRG
jgi:hypothetical protein